MDVIKVGTEWNGTEHPFFCTVKILCIWGFGRILWIVEILMRGVCANGAKCGCEGIVY